MGLVVLIVFGTVMFFFVCDGVCVLSDFNIFSVMKAKSDELFAISHTHGYRINFVPFAFRIFVLLYIWNRVDNFFLSVISHQTLPCKTLYISKST